MGQSDSKEMSVSQVKKELNKIQERAEIVREILPSKIVSFLSPSDLSPEAYHITEGYGILGYLVPCIVKLAQAREQQQVGRFESIMREFIFKLGLRLQWGSEGETSLIKAGWMAGADAPMYEYAKELKQLEREVDRLIVLQGDLENQRLAESRAKAALLKREWYRKHGREELIEIEENQRLRKTVFGPWSG